MNNDYLEYQFEQAVGEQLKGVLTAKDLANMVVTVKIEFKNNKETEEEKEAREKEEKKHARKTKKSEFQTKWEIGVRDRTSRLRTGELDNAGVKRERVELYEEYFPGEKEGEFLLHF